MLEDSIKIFYSYSRQDLEMRNTLEDHLSALRVAGKIITWHDLDLDAGTEWEPVILNKLDTADIILLLVSSSFIASPYCYSTELNRAIKRHNQGTARVIPIILRPCDWNIPDVPFSKLNVLPTHAKPITRWTDRDEAFTIVAQRIRETVDQLRTKKQANQQAEAAERLRQAEQLKQQQAAEQARLKQQELENQQQHQLKQEADKKQQQEQAQQPASDVLKENYGPLEALLKAGKWKEADQETAERMCQAMGRQEDGWLRLEDIEQFPCADLRAIDHLWVTYSNGKFGFSVQKKIWQQCGSPTANNEQWEKFGRAVGWRSKGLMGLGAEWKDYADLTFDPSAPDGHLPLGVFRVGRSAGWWGGREGVLFSHAEMCKL